MDLRRWIQPTIAALLCGLLAAPAAAQEQPLTADAPLVVTLAPGQPVLLHYRSAGETVDITVRAADAPQDADEVPIDPVLTVLDEAARVLAYADDHRTTDPADGEPQVRRDVRVRGLHLPAGPITLRVDSFSSAQAGEVVVTLTPADPFAPEETRSGDETVIRGTLPAGAVFRHTVSVRAGVPLTITARDESGTLDPLLSVYDEAGERLALADDHGSTDPALDLFDARLEWTPAQDGTVTLAVHDFRGRAGRFTLVIAPAPAAESP